MAASALPLGPAAGGGLSNVDDVMTWDGAVASWSRALRAAGRAETTIHTRVDHVRRLGRALGGTPWEVTPRVLLEYAGRQDWQRETRRSVQASVRSFYGWGRYMGYVDEDPTTDLPKVSPAAPRPRPAPEVVYRQALELADPRTTLILRLAAEVGLRRAEIAQVHTRDLVEDLVGWSLVVHGKGSRDRVVPLTTGLALALRERGPGWVFPGDEAGHLSPRWVGKLAVRVLPEPWTLHTLRHRFATAAYGLERDLLVVQTILGHSSPATTRRYVQIQDDAIRSTIRRMADYGTRAAVVFTGGCVVAELLAEVVTRGLGA